MLYDVTSIHIPLLRIATDKLSPEANWSCDSPPVESKKLSSDHIWIWTQVIPRKNILLHFRDLFLLPAVSLGLEVKRNLPRQDISRIKEESGVFTLLWSMQNLKNVLGLITQYEFFW